MMIQRRDTSARISTLKLALAAVVLGSTAAPTSALDAVPPVIELRGAENLGIGVSPSKAATAKVGADLLALHAEYQAHLNQTSGQGAAAPNFKSSNPIAPIAGGSVVIDTAASGDPEALAADLRALGAHKVAVFGRMVSARMPIPAISGLKRLSSLQDARPAYAATHGAVTSQGDAAMRADIGRTASGVDGTGVRVGTLSDSYDCLGGAAAGVASGDLPADVIVLEEGPCPATDEGRGMMELIRDVAPGASQAFHTGFEGQANFARGIIDLADAGAKVITDDVLVFAEPMFQDGIIAQAVDQVKARGISYFSAAGNDGRQSYESPFRGSGQFIDLGAGPEELHDFDAGTGVDTCQRITIPAGQSVTVAFQWDQPFFSVSGVPGSNSDGSNSDLDILLTDAACTTSLNPGNSGVELNVGRDPVEVVRFSNAGPATTFGVIILQFSGPAPGLMKTVLFGSSTLTINEFGTQSGTSFGHSAARGGLGVGAADYRDTPAFGQSPPLIENFSSAGGTPILFDTAGNRLATPEIRQQPDITAPDGTDTTFFGGSDPDETCFPNFFGTSAAAPHAAAVAALIAVRNPSFNPDDIYAVLKATAIDMDDPATPGFDTGFDYGTGFGLIQTDAALGAVPPLQPPAPPPPLAATCPILCDGLQATIVGTDGNDRLVGTSGNDVIHGLAGDDVITGLDGNDVICGGPGRDQLSGNRGKDRLFGGAGKDVLKGGAGSDRLFGQSGDDAMNGQSGFDRCNGGSGNDRAASCENTARVP
jgi:subtilase family protein/hemolysin type calcium-binding protein